MFGIIFSIISVLLQIGALLVTIGFLVYTAKTAWTYESAQDIWEELGKGRGAAQFVLLFLPTMAFWSIFWAVDVLKPVFAMAYKAIAKRIATQHRAKKNKPE